MKNINKKNYFKLFLLGLITPLLCGVSFAFDLTADEITYLDNNKLYSSSFINQTSVVLYDNGSPYNGIENICIVFSGLTFSNQYDSYSIFPADNTNVLSYSASSVGSTLPYYMYCTALENRRYLLMVRTSSSNYSSFTADKYRVVSATKIFNGNLGFDIQGLLDNYNQCQTDLNSCDTITNQCLIDKESLSGSLATCTANNVSLQNNIDSLTLQLQNCLGQSCNGSGVDIGTGLYFNQYSLYRTDDEIDYSTPITNNLFLPLGYKGKINEDNILSIAKINTLETAYQFDDTGKTTVINSMSIVMLFFLGTGLLIVVIMYLRRFISKK